MSWQHTIKLARSGGTLDQDQAYSLCQITEPKQLSQLLQAAQDIRQQRSDSLITYSPKVFIPLTKLCRDVCHYCTFAKPPRRGEACYLSLEEVLAIARAGKQAGCHEALFTLGELPELRYKQAKLELNELGFDSTLSYLEHCAQQVLKETGLIPHLNPGTMDQEQILNLRRVSGSMGLMLESTSLRLTAKGMPHYGSPDKQPAVRLKTLEALGREQVPTTSGILIGIGETRMERIDALLALRELHHRYGHLQEVIVQNFRAKADTLMAEHPEPTLQELLWTAAAARLILDREISLQVPPNLSDDSFPELLKAGINDWGGISPVTPDHVNPEAAWPQIEVLKQATEEAGLRLAPRLCLYPDRFSRLTEWADSSLHSALLNASDSDGLAREDSWFAGSTSVPPPKTLKTAAKSPLQIGGAIAEVLNGISQGQQPDLPQIVDLFSARGSDLTAVCAAADQIRQRVNGDTVTYVVNRNINYTNICYFHCSFCAFSKGKQSDQLRGKPYLVPLEEIARRVQEAWERGATEICLQGGIHPSFDGNYYLSVLECVKQAAPEIHVHAFSPLEIWQGAATLGLPLQEYLKLLKQAGLGSLPGTSAEILDQEIRNQICPDKNTDQQWLEIIETAHSVGIKSTSTIMFGHIEQPIHWARHLLKLRDLQARTGGFTEFVPLPFVHMEAPMALKGRSRSGPTFRENLLMHAVGRLTLHPLFENIQTSWVKLGAEGAAQTLLAGANDIGGTLMNESISRAAGASHGQEMTEQEIQKTLSQLERVAVQRTTLYGRPSDDDLARSKRQKPLAEPLNPPVKAGELEIPKVLLKPAGESYA